MKSCFFIGHREVGEELLPVLTEAVERYITQYRVREFIAGNYGGFDRLVIRVLREAKKRHPKIILLLLSPYHPAERTVVLPEGFDNIYHPPGMCKVPRQYATTHANRYMVDHTDYLIAHVQHPISNAWRLLQYAKRPFQVQIENISADDPD